MRVDFGFRGGEQFADHAVNDGRQSAAYLHGIEAAIVKLSNADSTFGDFLPRSQNCAGKRRGAADRRGRLIVVHLWRGPRTRSNYPPGTGPRGSDLTENSR